MIGNAGTRPGDQAHEPERNKQRGRPGHQSEHEPFDQQLSHDAPPPGAERQADRDLGASRLTPAEQQAGDIGARGEQDESDHPEGCRAGRRRQAAPDGLLEVCRQLAARIRFGVTRRQTPPERFELGPRLLQGGAFAQAREHVVAALVAGLAKAHCAPGHERAAQRHGRPHIGRQYGSRSCETLGRDTDYGAVGVVQPDCASDDAGIGLVAADPQAMADDDHRRAVSPIVGSADETAEFRTKAERGEVVAGDGGGHLDGGRSAVAADADGVV